MTKFLSFAPILLANKSKWVSEDSKRKKKFSLFFHKFLSMGIYFSLNRLERMQTKVHQNRSKKNMFFLCKNHKICETRPPKPPGSWVDCFGLNPPDQLVSGYWVSFVYVSNQVRKELKTQLSKFQFTKNFEHKIYHISTKNRKKQKIDFAYVSEHCVSFWTKKSATFGDILVNFLWIWLQNRPYLKSKNRKNRNIVFSLVSVHCA